MTKTFVSIVEISTLYDMLMEIKSNFSFNIINYTNTQDFLNEANSKKKDLEKLNPIIISKKNNINLLSSKIINIDGLILIEDTPIKISSLLDKINILLIKQKYDFQSQFSVKNYNINLNSKIISNREDNLKLTEREIDIILFLKQKKIPQSVNDLQNEVWKYSVGLETHTVETHIYRLRKKIKNKFDDDNFIISLKEGYKI
tara:strand:+ start:188 stop:790 length:603 start_codon:yes stop_codon:yes gene_type:complete